jgi:hypothetical protein
VTEAQLILGVFAVAGLGVLLGMLAGEIESRQNRKGDK